MSVIPVMPPETNPTLVGYTGQGAFRFWCQTVMPLVYDDSLSYYELLNKVVVYLNNVISDVSSAETNIGKLNEAYKSLRDYVEYYFTNLDVQHEIDKKLDNMAADPNSSLWTGINGILPDVVSDWLEENITPTTPVIDETLTIEGAGADSAVVGDTLYGDFNVSSSRVVSYITSLKYLYQLNSNSLGTFKVDKFENMVVNTYGQLNKDGLLSLIEPSMPSQASVTTFPNYDKLTNQTYIIHKSNYFAPSQTTNPAYNIEIFSFTGDYAWVGKHTVAMGQNTIEGETYDVIEWLCCRCPLDTTLAVAGVGAESKSVGDEINKFYNNRNDGVSNLTYIKNNSNPYIRLKYNTYIQNIISNWNPQTQGHDFTFNDIIDGCIGALNGATVKSLLSAATQQNTFPEYSKLNDSIYYTLEKYNPYPVAGTTYDVYYIVIKSSTRDLIWVGRHLHSYPTGSCAWEIVKNNIDYVDLIEDQGDLLESLIKTQLNELNSYCYTEFTPTTGGYKKDGTISNSWRRSQLLRVNPNERVYFSYPATIRSNDMAALSAYDYSKNFLGVIDNGGGSASIATYHEKTAGASDGVYPNDSTYPRSDAEDSNIYTYVSLYYFDVPANCYYVSLNLMGDTVSAVNYRQYVSNKECYMLKGVGDVVLNDGDPKIKNTSLCVIGPSTAMLDKLYRTAVSNQYLCGWQEYLQPFYNSVRTYGYSGCSYNWQTPQEKGLYEYTNGAYVLTTDQTFVSGKTYYSYSSSSGAYTAIVGTKNITDYILPDNPSNPVAKIDFTPYGEFIFLMNGNGYSQSILGDYTSTDITTYCGALKAIIGEIRRQNPKAKIYLQSKVAHPAFSVSAAETMNEAIIELCNHNSYEYIDITGDGGIGPDNWSTMAYDSNHYNQVGHEVMGKYMRRKICGC